MSFPRYPKYKPSGVEWLGQVPDHWEICALKRIVTMQSGESITAESIHESGDYPVFGGNGLRGYTSEYTHNGHFALVGRQGALCGNINYARGKFWASEHAVVVSPVKQTDTSWLGEMLRAMNLNQYSVSAAQPGLAVNLVSTLRTAVPPLPEQTTIAAFLDRETAKIDALIAEQQRLIELLKEKRQALISHAVTKGLNPNAPMKPSGIDWLGDVPAHWKISRLSPLSTKITNGYVGPTRDILTDEGIRYLQSLHIKKNEIRFDEPYYVSPEWSSQHSKSILETGDVLVVQTGDIGQATVVTDQFAGCNCHALIIIAPVRSVVDGAWISWVLNTDYGFHSLLSIQTGALHPHLNCGEVKDIFIPLPPLPEQRSIVAYVREQVTGFDSLISESQRAIDFLQERRTALISAAVTGQIDVRNHAAA